MYYRGIQIPPTGRGNFGGAVWRSVTYRENAASAVQTRLNRRSCYCEWDGLKESCYVRADWRRHLANTVEQLCAAAITATNGFDRGGDAAYFQIVLGSLN